MPERRMEIQIQIVRLEERLAAAEKALAVAAEGLTTWEKSANNWRGAINDERKMFVTRSDLIGIVGVLLAILTLALYILKR